MYLVPNIHPGSGSAGVPTVQANFAGSPADWTTLTTTTTMPTGGSISRAGNAMLYDSTGKLTYAPNNLLLNTATLSTQSVTTAAINYILSFKGTGSVALSGAYSGSLAGTGATDRVYLAFTSTAASLTLTVTGTVTEAQLEAVTYQTTPSTYVATTTSAYYGPRFDYDPSTLAAKGLLIEGSRANLLVYSDSMSSGWNTANATFSQASITSPAGTGTVAQVGSDGTAAYKSIYIASTASTASTAYTMSAYVKANTLTRVSLALISGTNDVRYWYDLSAKTVGGAVSTFTSGYVNSGIQDVGNGWLRCWLTAIAQSTTIGAYIYPGKADVNAAGNIYAFGAQLEQASFPSSYISTQASTVTRAAETFAITGYSSNLINTNYIDEQTGNTYQQPYNAGVAPSPSFSWLTGLRVYTNAYAGNIATPSWLSFSRTGNAMVTDSTGKLTYAPNNLLLNTATLSTQSVTTAAANYVLSFKGTGSVALSGAYSGSLAGTGASNRVSLAFTSTAASLTLTVTGTVTEAQLEIVTYETQPGPYVANTSSAYYGPRYDYDASTVPATPRGLLIEESRANLSYPSSDYSAATWNKLNTTVTAASVVAPDGTLTGQKITDNTTPAQHWVYSGVTITLANATAYTASFYFKYGNHQWVSIRGDLPSTTWASFDLLNGVAGSAAAGVTSSMVNVGNGWYRCSITWTTTSAGTGAVVAQFANANVTTTASYAGTGNDYYYLWGSQLEAGSFATSYIPTTSASVTRAADVAQLTGSALTVAGAATGTAIVQTTLWQNSTAAARDLLSSATTRRLLYSNSSNTVLSSTNGTTGLNATIGGSGTFTGGAVRSAVAWNASGRSLIANNGTLTSDAVNLSTGATATLGGYGTTTTFDGWIASMALYNQRLPDAILKQKSSVGAPY